MEPRVRRDGVGQWEWVLLASCSTSSVPFDWTLVVLTSGDLELLENTVLCGVLAQAPPCSLHLYSHLSQTGPRQGWGPGKSQGNYMDAGRQWPPMINNCLCCAKTCSLQSAPPGLLRTQEVFTQVHPPVLSREGPTTDRADSTCQEEPCSQRDMSTGLGMKEH